MTITFQTLMIIGFILGLIGAIGEKENEKLRAQMTAICVATVFGFLVATFIL